jgi:glyoxylase-like metal-dependent hydrolase (beta-lactamase superfamily II)
VTFNPIRIDAYNPSPMTGNGNHTYLLLDSSAEATLVDAGVGEPRHLADIERHLTDRGAQLLQVLVTHAHADHASGAPALAAAQPLSRFHKFPWPAEDQKYLVEWEPVSDGEIILAAGQPLTVLHTPGHSPDHIALWHEPSRTAFTGDLVTAGSSVMIEASKGGDLRQYLAALERILSLEPDRLFPAHGPQISEPAALLRQYLDHRRTREQQVIAALAAGRDSVQTIAEYIYDGLAPALMPAARENVRAHLDKLKAEGAAFEQHGRWTP